MSTFVRTQRFCVTGAFSMWRLKQSERPINHSTFITVGGRRGALWRSWLIPWEGFCIEPVQVFWLAHKNDPHNWQRLLCLNSIWKVYIANWEMDQQPFGLAHNFLDLALHTCLEASSAICDYDALISKQTAFWSCCPREMGKEESYLLCLFCWFLITSELA